MPSRTPAGRTNAARWNRDRDRGPTSRRTAAHAIGVGELFRGRGVRRCGWGRDRRGNAGILLHGCTRRNGGGRWGFAPAAEKKPGEESQGEKCVSHQRKALLRRPMRVK